MQALASRRETRKLIMPTATAADNRFRRYGQIDSHEVRKPDVTGQSYIEQARRAREMLRSMKPEAVSQIIEFHRDLTFFEALALAKREGKLIVPNFVHDRILTETKDMKLLRQLYGAWVRTGTLVIYEKPDKPFSEQVIYSWERDKVQHSVSFQIPKQFRGKTNCALVIEHPDFELVDRELVASSRPANPSGFVVHSSSPRKIGELSKGQTDLGNNNYEIKSLGEIRLMENFPKKDGWYNTDPETKIPIGEPVRKSEKEARYLWRLDRAYLGPLVRYVDDFYNRVRNVNASERHDYGFGVALF